MDKDSQRELTREEKHHKHKVHHVLAHSYLIYFFLLLLAVFLDLIFPIEILHDSTMLPIGFVILAIASLLIFWAQRTSLKLQKIEEIKKESFHQGPYRYTKSPTHLGLFLLVLGFGFIVNDLFIIIFTVISFLISKFFLLKKQEKLLTERYGEAYTEYKKSVKF